MRSPNRSQSSRVFRFGQFELSEREGELRKGGVRIRLQDQPLRVLVELLANAGRMVTRDELQQKLWPADTFVDFDVGLNTAIRKLRQALGDEAESPRYIETLAKRGYRFIGIIEIPTANLSARLAPWQWLLTTRNVRNIVVMALIVCALVPPFLFYLRLIRPKAVQTSVIPVVTSVGEKYTPTLSPDGQHLAFVWNGGAGPDFNLHVKVQTMMLEWTRNSASLGAPC
jgi:DNA-binding winged helix-turn-helix (wHTH) protein